MSQRITWTLRKSSGRSWLCWVRVIPFVICNTTLGVLFYQTWYDYVSTFARLNAKTTQLPDSGIILVMDTFAVCVGRRWQRERASGHAGEQIWSSVPDQIRCQKWKQRCLILHFFFSFSFFSFSEGWFLSKQHDGLRLICAFIFLSNLWHKSQSPLGTSRFWPCEPFSFFFSSCLLKCDTPHFFLHFLPYSEWVSEQESERKISVVV